MSKLKTFRVEFEIRGYGHRDVEALDSEEAVAQVENDQIDATDCERGNFESIVVDEVYLAPKPKHARRARK